MYKIKEVEIKNMWGESNIFSKLDSDINMFIGDNGSGKTTFINLIQATILVDLNTINNINFTEISLLLKFKDKTKKIRVIKSISEDDEVTIEYKIGRIPYIFKNISYQLDRIKKRRILTNLSKLISDKIFEIRESISQLINLSWLAVDRRIYNPVENYEMKKHSYDYDDTFHTTIDKKLALLRRAFYNFHLQLDGQTLDLTNEFQKDLLKILLFDESFDDVDEILSSISKLNVKGKKERLKKAFESLGILSTDIEKQISKHIDKFSKSISSLKKDPNKIRIDDLFVIPLMKRTDSIIHKFNELETNKIRIFEPISNYIKIVNSYFKDKSIINSNGNLCIIKNDNPLPFELLSSGEKQLVIFFTEILLNYNKTTTFIADEPELSLHIDWQRKLIDSIITLNKNSQIIIATHSPEIVSMHPSKIVNMENIKYGSK